jgi:hypothetical protein
MHAREEERCVAHPGVLGDEKEGRRRSPATRKEKWPGVDEADVAAARTRKEASGCRASAELVL